MEEASHCGISGFGFLEDIVVEVSRHFEGLGGPGWIRYGYGRNGRAWQGKDWRYWHVSVFQRGLGCF